MNKEFLGRGWSFPFHFDFKFLGRETEARCLLSAFRHFNFGDSNTADARCFARTWSAASSWLAFFLGWMTLSLGGRLAAIRLRAAMVGSRLRGDDQHRE